MTTTNVEYEASVEAAVKLAWSSGTTELQAVLAAGEGADPREVLKAIGKLSGEDQQRPAQARLDHRRKTDSARRDTASAVYSFPAEDPSLSQWWFSLDASHLLASRLARLVGRARVGFIGAPSVGIYYQSQFGESIVLDADTAVCEVAQETIKTTRCYDVVDSLPKDLMGQCDAVVIDAPWYDEHIRRFFARASQLCRDDGYILSTYPPRLTRPLVMEQRTCFLRDVEQAGFLLVSLEPQVLEYSVPQFELQAFVDVIGFSSHPWRYGDLLIHRKSSGSVLPIDDWGQRTSVERFSREARHFRVFLDRARATPTLPTHTETIAGFGENISTRVFDSNALAVWTSDKAGIAVRDADSVAQVLNCWRDNYTKTQAAEVLVTKCGYRSDEAELLVEELEDNLRLWSTAEVVARRTTEQMADFARSIRSEWAEDPSQREHGQREDGYRLQFQRDRDRVLWSGSFRRLAQKTQVFDLEGNDNLRQRLTHSIEVMQLASTVGASLGLDRDLIEAGALAHDIGHTPFGHSGEHALDVVLDTINPALGGFNHYEHGVDVVRYLEDVYAQPAAGGYRGLNLTPEVPECIFKHTFCLGGHKIGQAELYAKSKHTKLFSDGPCHLEGQAVRLADKVSYLISDLEDGVRMGVFTYEDLKQVRLFRRAPIDLRPSLDESLLERFTAQRRALIQVLMEDAIDEAARRLSACAILADVRKAKRYVIDHSESMKVDVNEIWNLLQRGKLHRSGQVMRASLRAGKLVGELLILFALVPDLVDRDVRRSHDSLDGSDYLKWYERRNSDTDVVGVPERLCRFVAPERLIGLALDSKSVTGNYRIRLRDLVQAKDYVASLTDGSAKRLHQQFVVGG